ADVLLGDEAGAAQRPRIGRIGCRIDAADHGQRARVAAPRLRAARRIAGDDEAAAPPAEVAAVRRLLGDLPDAGEADAARVQQAAIAFAVRTPAEIGLRCHRAPRRGEVLPWLPERQDSAQKAAERNGEALVRPRVGIREDRVTHVSVARAGPAPVVVGDAFYAIWIVVHGASGLGKSVPR